MTVIMTAGLAGSASGLAGGGAPAPSHHAGTIPQDRLIRKEVALGVIREIIPPETHIGLATIAPLLSVPTDDVIFQYAQGITDGLSPARAEDAEAPREHGGEEAERDHAPSVTLHRSLLASVRRHRAMVPSGRAVKAARMAVAPCAGGV